MLLEQNIKGLCQKNGIDFQEFLEDMDVEHTHELTLYDLEAVAEEYEVDLQALLFKPMFKSDLISKKLSQIKLIVLDVDGVLTDGGMYFTENGDQIKKYNTKDGMAIQYLIKRDYQIALISSGFKSEMVKARAEMLGIQHCYVGRENKLMILKGICETLSIGLENVAILGDDVNDAEIIAACGFSACPGDAIPGIKSKVDVILTKKGGEGCVREFVDNFLFPEPII